MTRTRPESAIAAEGRPGGTPPESQPARRTVQLDELAGVEPDPEPEPAPVEPQPHANYTAPRPTDHLMRLAERVVGDWAPTLREALLRVLIFAVILSALGVALGVEFVIAGAVVGVISFLVGRCRAGSR